jgi:SAM-dependent methyltransferase
MSLMDRAHALSEEMFLGGPEKLFERFGRLQFITLIRNGLCPSSKLLDVGCGCLRGGYWTIQFLNPGHYFGIEPNEEMLKAGIERILESNMMSEKKPRFDNNTEFNFSVFNEVFDFVFARSIWTHTSKKQIKMMLDSFAGASHNGSVLLTSFIPAGFHMEKGRLLKPKTWHRGGFFFRPDYKGDEWVGKSHESDEAGTVAHRYSWIAAQCHKRDSDSEMSNFPQGQEKQGITRRRTVLRRTSNPAV